MINQLKYLKSLTKIFLQYDILTVSQSDASISKTGDLYTYGYRRTVT